MKRKILFIVLVCLSLAAVSVWGQDEGRTSHGDHQTGGTSASGDYFFTNGKNGGTYISNAKKSGTSTSFTALEDASMNFQITMNKSGASAVNFGIYTFDQNMNVISETSWANVGSSFGTVYDSQDFSAGDMVGFWVEVDGKKYYSVDVMNADGVKASSWQINNGELILGFDSDGIYSGTGNFTIEVSVKAQAAKAPTGQPLPGMIFSIVALSAVFAGMGFYAIRRRRRA